MRKLVVCLGTVLSLAVFAASTRADIVIEQTNSAAQLFNGTSGSKTVTFATGLFPASADILDIEVSISFSKRAASVGTSPFYNEISFSFFKPEVGPAIGFIKPGTAGFGFTGSFSEGLLGDPGFNGTLTFKQSAATVVNSNPDVMPPSGGTYRPVDSMAAFIGQSGSGTYTLNIGDSANTGDPGLQFNSFTVRITAVPEPTSLACLGLLATAGAFVRRRRVR